MTAETIQNEYELVLILRPDLDDAETNAIIEKVQEAITENGGQLLDRDEWGKRKLAYPIDNHLKGHYVLYTFVSPATLILELERRLRIIDTILRFLTVKQMDAVDAVARVEETAEQRRLREEARAAAAAEESEGSDDDESDTATASA